MKVKIGLETHVELKTNSKLFCSCSAEGETPNDSTCQTCLGFPGSKPQLNKKVIELAVQIATLLNCKVNRYSEFSRKTYFYPDLAKSFQITQYESPVASEGLVEIETKNGKKKIRVRRIQIEEDPAKTVYPEGNIATSPYVLLDYNRSGIPLCEIVTEPDFETVEEAVSYTKYVFDLLNYMDIINADRDGVLRTDANVSIDGGERVELKNISGSDALEKSIKAEVNRQASLRTSGKKINRETRVYSEETGTTIKMRDKEGEEDYGYISEPDLPILEVSEDYLKLIKASMKKLPQEEINILINVYNISDHVSNIIVYQKGMLEFFTECSKSFKNYDLLSRWIVNDLLKCLNWNKKLISSVDKKAFLEFLQLLQSGQINERQGKEIIKEFVSSGKFTIHSNIDISELDGAIMQLLSENKKAVDEYKSGKTKAFEFLLGQILRKTKAKFKVDLIRQELKKKLD